MRTALRLAIVATIAAAAIPVVAAPAAAVARIVAFKHDVID